MKANDSFTVFNSGHLAFYDPRFQRRIVAVSRPIPIVENMFDVKFECGHSPFLFADAAPAVGDCVFCPGCYEAAKKASRQ